jgi:hypothetical protein
VGGCGWVGGCARARLCVCVCVCRDKEKGCVFIYANYLSLPRSRSPSLLLSLTLSLDINTQGASPLLCKRLCFLFVNLFWVISIYFTHSVSHTPCPPSFLSPTLPHNALSLSLSHTHTLGFSYAEGNCWPKTFSDITAAIEKPLVGNTRS